jgi:hypothetical protein
MLEGDEWSAACPGHTLPLGKTRYPLYRRLGGPQGWCGQAENLAPTGIRSPDSPALSQLLYRLSYPAYCCFIGVQIIHSICPSIIRLAKKCYYITWTTITNDGTAVGNELTLGSGVCGVSFRWVGSRAIVTWLQMSQMRCGPSWKCLANYILGWMKWVVYIVSVQLIMIVFIIVN